MPKKRIRSVNGNHRENGNGKPICFTAQYLKGLTLRPDGTGCLTVAGVLYEPEFAEGLKRLTDLFGCLGIEIQRSRLSGEYRV